MEAIAEKREREREREEGEGREGAAVMSGVEGGGAAASSSRQEQLIKEFELKRRAQTIIVPTNDGAVRQQLRDLGEPITLFGERELERRDRLRSLLTGIDAQGKGVVTTVETHEEEEEVTEVPLAELFYTEGTPELLSYRRKVAKDSLQKAAKRMRRLKEEKGAIEKSSSRLLSLAKEVSEDCSEFGDERPLSDCGVTSDGQLLCTASWSGTYKVWKTDGCSRVSTVRAHEDRITGIAWHPSACGATSSSAPAEEGDVLQVATACCDSTARLWSKSGKLLHTLEGHTDRLARISFHPSGTCVGTASFDKTWRLWDVNTGVNLLEQEGHSKEVYSLSFQCDGSLALSCGLDAIGRVWDLRTGKCIRTLRGHVKSILSSDFSPNGYQVATGSDDHTCMIWDLRMSPRKMNEKQLYTIAAHQSLISKVRYAPDNGALLLTASYDKKVKLWSSKDFTLLNCLEGHEGRIMGADIIPETNSVVSVAYDRTIKFWNLKGSEMEVEEGDTEVPMDQD